MAKEPTITVSFNVDDKILLERLRIKTKLWQNTALLRRAIRALAKEVKVKNERA
jgi:hypothetical protein